MTVYQQSDRCQSYAITSTLTLNIIHECHNKHNTIYEHHVTTMSDQND